MPAEAAPPCDLSCQVDSTSCMLVLSFIFLFRLRLSAPMSLRFWGGVGDSLGLEITQRAYLNRLIPSPSSHCRRPTLILCAGTLDSWMHQCVACTKVMAILLLTYRHVLYQGCCPFVARRLDILFRVTSASTPSIPSTEATKGETC